MKRQLGVVTTIVLPATVMSENRQPPGPLPGTVALVNPLDPDVCDRALETRDERSDGRFVPEGSVAATGVTVRLRYRPPYDWPAMLAFLRARAIDGVEYVQTDSYRRTIFLDGHPGTLEITHLPALHSLAATLRFPDVRALPKLVARIRRVFDLGADVTAIGAHLARDPMLAPLIASRPGLRTPGAWDGFELAMRAVLGQQVTVEAGRRLAVSLVRLCGTPVPGVMGSLDVRDSSPGMMGSLEVRDSRPGVIGNPVVLASPALPSAASLTLAFPTAAQVATADLSALGMPNARRQTLIALARAALADPHLFEPLDTVEQTVARLRAIPGVGDWTAHYIALRAAREPDAFPASDVALLRAATAPDGTRPDPAQLTLRAERWRPFRAYAAQHLWAAAAAPIAPTAPSPATAAASSANAGSSPTSAAPPLDRQGSR